MIRQNIETEKSNFSNQFQNLKACVTNMNIGGIFEQIEKLDKKNSDLQQRNESILMKHFLLVLELDRRTHAYDKLNIKYDQLRSQVEKERKQYSYVIEKHRKNLDDELRSRLTAELESLTSVHKQEIRRYEERARELQNQLSSKEGQNKRLGEALARLESEKGHLQGKYQALEKKFADHKHETEIAMKKREIEFEDRLKNMQENHNLQMEKARSQAENKLQSELQNLKSQLDRRNQMQLNEQLEVVNSLQIELERRGKSIEEQNRELQGLNNRLVRANDEVEKLTNNNATMAQNHKNELLQTKTAYEDNLKKQVYETERQLTEHYNAEINNLQRALKGQKDIVLQLEKNEAYLSKEKARLSRDLDDLSKDADEWRSKYQDVKASSEKVIQQLKIEKTTIINGNNNEVERLNLKLKSMQNVHESEKQQLSQEIEELRLQLNEMEKQLLKQKQIDEMRKKEIEKWTSTYSNYVTAEK